MEIKSIMLDLIKELLDILKKQNKKMISCLYFYIMIISDIILEIIIITKL